MKIRAIAFICFALAALYTPALAHTYEVPAKGKDKKKPSKGDKKTSKRDQKAWKKRAKQYSKNPMALKDLVSSKVKSDNRADSVSQEIEAVQSTLEEKDAKIEELEEQLSRVNSELATARASLEKRVPAGPDYTTGVLFRVQIGAFQRTELSQFFSNNPNFVGETTPSGEQRVSIGLFRDYWEADRFKKELRRIGVRDAWIVPYRDGQRVDIKEVMSNIPAEG